MTRTPSRCGQHITHAHNHFTRSISSHGQLFRPCWASSAWRQIMANQIGPDENNTSDCFATREPHVRMLVLNTKLWIVQINSIGKQAIKRNFNTFLLLFFFLPFPQQFISQSMDVHPNPGPEKKNIFTVYLYLS